MPVREETGTERSFELENTFLPSLFAHFNIWWVFNFPLNLPRIRIFIKQNKALKPTQTDSSKIWLCSG